jgi:hypothetical protein
MDPRKNSVRTVVLNALRRLVAIHPTKAPLLKLRRDVDIR